MRVLFALLISWVAACAAPDSAGDDGKNPVDTGGPAAADISTATSLRVTPAALLLRGTDDTVRLKVEALDTNGVVLGRVPADQITLTSTDTDVVVTSGVSVTGGPTPGLSDVVVEGPAGTRARVNVMRADVVDGVKLVSDADVVEPTTLLRQNGSIVGAVYRFVQRGPPLSVGDSVLGTGAQSVAGVVTAVRPTDEGQEVEFETVHPSELISAPLEFQIPVRQEEVQLDPELEGVVEYDPKTGTYTPVVAADTGASAVYTVPGSAGLKCDDPSAESIFKLQLGVQQIKPSLKIDVAFTDNPRILLTGSLGLDASAKLLAGINKQSFDVSCKLRFGRWQMGAVYIPVGILPLYVAGEVGIGLGVNASAKALVGPQLTLFDLGVGKNYTLTAGFQCEGENCSFVNEFEATTTREVTRVGKVSAMVAAAEAKVDAFAYATFGLSLYGVVPIELVEVRGGGRATFDYGLLLAQELNDRDYRTDVVVSKFASVGPGATVRSVLSTVSKLLEGLLPDLSKVNVSVGTEWVDFLQKLPDGSLQVDGKPDGSDFTFTVDLTHTQFFGKDVIGKVSIAHAQDFAWDTVASQAYGGGGHLEIPWSPAEPLKGKHKFAVVLTLVEPFNWIDVEVAKDGIVPWEGDTDDTGGDTDDTDRGHHTGGGPGGYYDTDTADSYDSGGTTHVDTSVDTSMDTDTGSPADTDVVMDTDTGAPVDTDVVVDTDTGSPVDTDVVVDTDTVVPPDTDVVVDTDTGSPVDTDVVVDTDTGSPVDTDVVVDTDTVPPPTDTDTAHPPTDTDTGQPPTDTDVPPTDTDTVPPPTDTDVPPTDTDTVPPPTDTDVPPTDTDTVPPPTDTDVPPTDTDTVPPPTDTDVPPTDTDVPPTDTDTVPPPTDTDVPPPTDTDPPPWRCGNWVVDPGEGCDDGGLIDGDGCSSVCQIEVP